MLHIKDNTMSIVRKDTGVFEFSVENYTLTDGDIVYFTVAEDVGSQQKVIQKLVGEFNNGVAQFSISKTDSDIEPGTYVYDIQVNRADGQVDTVIGPAKFKVIEGVTF